MKTLLLLLLCTLFANLPARAAEPAPSLPVVVVDAEHLQMGQDKDAPLYKVPAGPGLVLDASKYKFDLPAQAEPPNSVQIVWEGGQYAAEWKPKDGKLTLDASTLQPLVQAKPFTGFKKGETVIVAIGRSQKVGTELKFSVVWVGMIEIQ